MRILTANIWARRGPYETRAPLLRREVALLAPDVMTLIEVDVSAGGGNQAEELFGALGYHVEWLRGAGQSEGLPGIAIASRRPLTDARPIALPHDGAALAAMTEVDGERLWVCCACPMSWKPGREIERENEVVALDEALSELADGHPLPPIIAGDFDATPDAASIRFLTGLQSLQGRSTTWTDAWAVAGDGSAGYTWSSDNPYVAPFSAALLGQPEHHRRIDYIFVGSPFRWSPRVVVRDCRVVLKETASEAPSDHYGVVADLSLDGVVLAGGTGEERWDGAAGLLWGQEGEGRLGR
jgi:endonuclease/exonuclease/phosphatase family metal-dependent hydrolase